MPEPADPRGPTSALRVYDGDEVDRYVSSLQAEIDALNAEVLNLRERLDAAISTEDLQSAERALGRALLQAQYAADEAAEEAQRERERIADSSRREREALLAEFAHHRAVVEQTARREADALRAQLDEERARVVFQAEQEARAILTQARAEAASILNSGERKESPPATSTGSNDPHVPPRAPPTQPTAHLDFAPPSAAAREGPTPSPDWMRPAGGDPPPAATAHGGHPAPDWPAARSAPETWAPREPAPPRPTAWTPPPEPAATSPGPSSALLFEPSSAPEAHAPPSERPASAATHEPLLAQVAGSAPPRIGAPEPTETTLQLPPPTGPPVIRLTTNGNGTPPDRERRRFRGRRSLH